MNNIGQIIKGLRKRNGLTQSKLAEIIHVSDKTISKWELGLSVPESDILVKLSEYFNVSVEDLIKGNKKILITKDIKKKRIMVGILICLIFILSILLFNSYYKRKSDVYVLSGNDNYSLNGLIYNTSKKQVIELNNLSTKLDFGNDLTQEITIILKSNNTIINSLEFDNETPLSPVNDYLLKFDLSLSGKADYYLLPSQINDLSLVIEYIKNGTLQIKEFAINANKL
jgi:transcriptional regulator with XRE-family HTH domain